MFFVDPERVWARASALLLLGRERPLRPVLAVIRRACQEGCAEADRLVRQLLHASPGENPIVLNAVLTEAVMGARYGLANYARSCGGVFSGRNQVFATCRAVLGGKADLAANSQLLRATRLTFTNTIQIDFAGGLHSLGTPEAVLADGHSLSDADVDALFRAGFIAGEVLDVRPTVVAKLQKAYPVLSTEEDFAQAWLAAWKKGRRGVWLLILSLRTMLQAMQAAVDTEEEEEARLELHVYRAEVRRFLSDFFKRQSYEEGRDPADESWRAFVAWKLHVLLRRLPDDEAAAKNNQALFDLKISGKGRGTGPAARSAPHRGTSFQTYLRRRQDGLMRMLRRQTERRSGAAGLSPA
jgi:hypothetical protein